jgi:hypothetical protein
MLCIRSLGHLHSGLLSALVRVRRETLSKDEAKVVGENQPQHSTVLYALVRLCCCPVGRLRSKTNRCLRGSAKQPLVQRDVAEHATLPQVRSARLGQSSVFPQLSGFPEPFFGTLLGVSPTGRISNPSTAGWRVWISSCGSPKPREVRVATGLPGAMESGCLPADSTFPCDARVGQSTTNGCSVYIARRAVHGTLLSQS